MRNGRGGTLTSPRSSSHQLRSRGRGENDEGQDLPSMWTGYFHDCGWLGIALYPPAPRTSADRGGGGRCRRSGYDRGPPRNPPRPLASVQLKTAQASTRPTPGALLPDGLVHFAMSPQPCEVTGIGTFLDLPQQVNRFSLIAWFAWADQLRPRCGVIENRPAG